MARFGVLTGGGDCPGLNAVIRAIVRRGDQLGHEFFGFRYGWAGVLAGDGAELTAEATRGILHRGGTILGTSRTNPYKEENGLERVQASLAQHSLDGLIPIGGEDTLGVAGRLSEDGIDVVGVPKTIDNDLAGTDFTFGFQTAVQIATDAIDRLHTTAESHNRVIVVEVMGRTAGWIACYSGMAGGADAILVPERPFDIEEVCARVRRRHGAATRSRSSSSPRARRRRTARSSRSSAPGDAFGHVRLGGIAVQLEREIEERTGFETRMTILGHVQRGGTPTAYDRVLGTRFGVAAIDAADGATSGRWSRCAGQRSCRLARRGAGGAEAARPAAVRDRRRSSSGSSVQAVFKQGPVPAFVHGIVEYAAAILFIAAPFVFDFTEDAATALSLVVGVLILIIAASTALADRADPVDFRGQAHVMLDYVLAIFLIASPFLLGFTDDGTAAAFFIVLGVVHLLLTIATRFITDERPPRPKSAAKSTPESPCSRRSPRGATRPPPSRTPRGCRRCSTPRRRSRGRWRARA